jgi:WD40 repeat protein
LSTETTSSLSSTFELYAQVCFNPQGTRILTASSDKTAKLWEVETGDCMQVRRFYFGTVLAFICGDAFSSLSFVVVFGGTHGRNIQLRFQL